MYALTYRHPCITSERLRPSLRSVGLTRAQSSESTEILHRTILILLTTAAHRPFHRCFAVVYYVPTLDPNTYAAGKITCCDGFANITRHVDEVLADSGHVGVGPNDGVFFDNGPFAGAHADALYHKIYAYAQQARQGAPVPVIFNAQGPTALTQDYMAMEHASFIGFESFPRYWHSQWFDNRSHQFNWSAYPRQRFGTHNIHAQIQSVATFSECKRRRDMTVSVWMQRSGSTRNTHACGVHGQGCSLRTPQSCKCNSQWMPPLRCMSVGFT